MRFIRKYNHFLMMVAGCGTMIVVVFTLTTTASGGNWGLYLLLLLCPALHFWMHRKMHGNRNLQKMPYRQLPAPRKKTSVGEQPGPIE